MKQFFKDVTTFICLFTMVALSIYAGVVVW